MRAQHVVYRVDQYKAVNLSMYSVIRIEHSVPIKSDRHSVYQKLTLQRRKFMGKLMVSG